MTSWDPADCRKTAIHEAGHAVVGWTLGILPTGGASLDHEKEGGRVDFPRVEVERLPPDQQIAIWLACFEAEQLLVPPARKRTALADEGEVWRIQRENDTTFDQPEGQALREQGRVLAELKLREHKVAVLRVADALVEKSVLSQEEILSLLDDPD
jgi:hypothetical protein